MRKAFSAILATVIVLSVCATTAFAAGPGGGRYFVDADGDGICDNSGSVCIYADADRNGVCDVCGVNHGICLTGEGTAFADADGDGICDNCGAYHWRSMAGIGCGENFVDTDGDGVCDNYVSGQCGGNGRGNGAQGRRGGNFVDADGDGVCDNYAPGQGQGGYGCGSQGGRGNGIRGGRGR